MKTCKKNTTQNKVKSGEQPHWNVDNLIDVSHLFIFNWEKIKY